MFKDGLRFGCGLICAGLLAILASGLLATFLKILKQPAGM